MLKIKFLITLALIPILQVNSGVQKTFKPANFDDDVPKFTPFEDEDLFGSKSRHLKTTETATIPSPSAETLTNKKISSKIKMPEKYVADLNKIKDVRKIANDFGSFDFKNSENKVSAEEEFQEISKDDVKNTHEEETKEEEEEIAEEIEVTENLNSTLFKIGQLFNVTVDSDDDKVKVNLDQHALKEIFIGRKSSKKYGLLEKFVPLFILPFIIQSAILPFMVAKIKILLMKSLFAGKLALMLFLLGALKTHSGGGYSKSYGQNAPFLIKDFPFLPEKRIENNVPDHGEYEKKAEPFVRSLHSQ